MKRMNKKAQMSLGIIIVAFMGIIVGLALLNASAAEVSISTTKAEITDETTNLSVSCYTAADEVNETEPNCNITVTNAPEGWKITECPIENVVVSNNTGTALTLNTDYNLFASTGIIQMLDTVDTNATGLGENVLIDYDYCRDGYNTQASSRTIINLVLLFLAIALMAFAYGPVREALGNMGIGD